MITNDKGKVICGAKNRNGQPCQLKPLDGKKRCNFHGGMSSGPKTEEGKARIASNATKHGLYAQHLRTAFGKMGVPPEVYDSLPRTTDLTEEIAVARGLVIHYTDLLASGVKWILSNGKAANTEGGFSEAAMSVNLLLDRAMDRLRALTKTQHDVRPGGDIGGNLRFVFEVSAEAEKAVDEAVPDLTDDASSGDEDAPEDAELDPEPDVRPKGATGYEDD